MPDTLTGAEREAARLAWVERRLAAAAEQLADRRVAIEQFNGVIGADSKAFTARKGEPHPSRHPVVLKYPDRFRPMSESEIAGSMRCLRFQIGD